MSCRPDDVHASFSERPLDRVRAELVCLSLAFRPHANNSHARKAGTILVVGVWAALELGAAFGVAMLPEQFTFIRLFVGVLIGRMWGIEINNFAGVEFSYTNGDGGDDGD